VIYLDEHGNEVASPSSDGGEPTAETRDSVGDLSRAGEDGDLQPVLVQRDQPQAEDDSRDVDGDEQS
jgi:hypothetical protein